MKGTATCMFENFIKKIDFPFTIVFYKINTEGHFLFLKICRNTCGCLGQLEIALETLDLRARCSNSNFSFSHTSNSILPLSVQLYKGTLRSTTRQARRRGLQNKSILNEPTSFCKQRHSQHFHVFRTTRTR